MNDSISRDKITEHLVKHHRDYSIWLTTYGRKTGKPRVVQIWFAYLNGEFCILSRHGAESWWARNILSNNNVIVNLSGLAVSATAETVSDRELTDLVWKYYRGKYRFYPQTYAFSWKKRLLFRIRFRHIVSEAFSDRAP
ncbi:MAG: nitroreductase/quinone reductase family protein [Thermoprotei archaeon]